MHKSYFYFMPPLGVVSRLRRTGCKSPDLRNIPVSRHPHHHILAIPPVTHKFDVTNHPAMRILNIALAIFVTNLLFVNRSSAQSIVGKWQGKDKAGSVLTFIFTPDSKFQMIVGADTMGGEHFVLDGIKHDLFYALVDTGKPIHSIDVIDKSEKGKHTAMGAYKFTSANKMTFCLNFIKGIRPTIPDTAEIYDCLDLVKQAR